ncbi:SpoIIAA family protein [Methylomarinum vadi]|uniref:STAS/SEC14 domain-containing protein n=1 Tax=Methylomarinum vadi TaxID=438855 RepID=UPI0004DF5260|nr:STAS/SEC14 domain-containing protein [Methylomarinum vadi]
MIELIPNDSPKILGFKLTGTLHDEDYQAFIPVVEKTLAKAEGEVSLLAKFEDFHGWDLNAAWDDLKFGVQHYSDFDRIALVGDKQWEEWMARLCKPFTQATVKYFDISDEEAAWAWLRERP